MWNQMLKLRVETRQTQGDKVKVKKTFNAQNVKISWEDSESWVFNLYLFLDLYNKIKSLETIYTHQT